MKIKFVLRKLEIDFPSQSVSKKSIISQSESCQMQIGQKQEIKKSKVMNFFIQRKILIFQIISISYGQTLSHFSIMTPNHLKTED
jgi:hypothetical protein